MISLSLTYTSLVAFTFGEKVQIFAISSGCLAEISSKQLNYFSILRVIHPCFITVRHVHPSISCQRLINPGS